MLRLAPLRNRIKSFERDENGSQAVELVIWAPVLLWCLAAGFTFFEGFRAQATAEKAAYAISDMISRETLEIDDTYITNMGLIFAELSGMPEDGTSIAVSMLRWDQDDNRFYVDWSESRGAMSSLGNADTDEIEDLLPELVDNERIILVETATDWEPPFSVGVPGRNVTTFVFTRPRYSPQLVWAD